MLTEFGKALRKIRIDSQELLKDMAARLHVSSAYLSAVETGKRKIPTDWVTKICELYALSKEDAQKLQNASDDSMQEVRIDLAGVSAPRRDTVLSFAKAIDGLSDIDLKKIMDVVKKTNRSDRHA